jgi:hypothetical protein
MSPHEAVLAAARIGVDADTAEEGFIEIRTLTGMTFSDAELAEAIAKAVRDCLVRDPVRLLPGALQCRWQLELARHA